MPHINRSRRKLLKAINYLYTAKAYSDAMTHYMTDTLDDITLFELLRNPSFFMNVAIYNQFKQKYFPQMNTTTYNTYNPNSTLYRTLVEQTIRQNMTTPEQRRQRIYNINYERLQRDARKIRQNKQIPDNTPTTTRINNILNNTTRDLTDQHEKLMNRQIENLEKEIQKLREEDQPIIKTPNIKENPEVKKLREKHRKEIIRQNKRLEKNKNNRVKWMTERLKDKPRKYKVWNQTPNPKTRHTITDGQKVPIEEKFEVINDKTGQVDMMDYPGDWTGSPANTANCLCELTFTDDDKNVYDPKKKSVRDEYKELQEKVDTLTEGFDKRLIKLINDATFLGNDDDITWVLKHLNIGYKEKGCLHISDINKALVLREEYIQMGYHKNDFNLEKLYSKIYMEHVTSNVDELYVNIDKRTSDSHSYNQFAKLLHSTLDDKKNYSSEELVALKFYYRNKYYYTFNEWQRSNFSKKVIDDAVHNKKSPLYKQNSDSLEKFFKEKYDILKDMRVTLDHDVILYHVQDNLYSNDGEELNEKGMWNNTLSLSAFKQSSLRFKKRGVLFKIYVPKGTKVTPILQLSKIKYTYQTEVLLDRGHQYQIDNKYNEDDYMVIDVRLIE